MTLDDGTNEVGEREEAPVLDESWWDAVLEEEEHQVDYTEPEIEGGSDRRIINQGDPEDWIWARELYQEDEVVDLPIVGFNRGGLLVEARSLRGFVPLSHLTNVQPDLADELRLKMLEDQVGQQMGLKVIEFDPERGRLVLSQRAALAGPGRRVELLTSLNPGDRVQGEVTNITRFGVFVDLGGVEGLIHVSELSWGRVGHPSDVVECGQEIEVQIISVDRGQDRVALSLKELLPDPWEQVDEHYSIEQIVEGVVTNVVKFGAFIGIEEGLEGLIHVSELGDGSFLHPRNVLHEGEQVRVRIIHIDASDRRLGLSLRGVPQTTSEESEPEIESSASLPAM
ncbi:MAG: S1 RNA-binding domain-containing protein [Anaerolineales bacterium]|nr:MAG: S1 RNA-binding domain-containing protein [Anaerolineales bacterium]